MMQRLARERGMLLDCRSAGIEPDAQIPPHVVEGLRADDVDVSGLRPQAATQEMVFRASHVVAFGCDVMSWNDAAQRWDDVPAVSQGYSHARNVIVTHLNTLADEIAKGA